MNTTNTLDTSMNGRDVFIKTTTNNGANTFSQHCVWDADRFMAARQREVSSSKADPFARASVERITPDQFKVREV